MKLSVFRNRWITPWCAWILACVMIGLPSPAGGAGICAPDDLADLPLELTMNAGPPALLLVSFDNSDSMGFEVLTNDLDRQFTHPVDGSKQNYVFNSAGGAYTALVRDAWQSQFRLVNKMYYNPYVGGRDEYLPWPTKANVNTSTPPWDPQLLGGATYNLDGIWATYNVGIGFVPPPAHPTVVVDTVAKGGTNPAKWEWSNDGYPVPAVPGISGHWWTKNASGQTMTASWETTLLVPAVAYNIQIYCNSDHPDTADFTLHDGATLKASVANFAQNTTGWKDLFLNQTFSGTAKVSLSRAIPNNQTKVGADAVRFVPVGGGGGGIFTIPVNIKNRHFYLKSANGNIFLVSLVSADSALFFQLVDANGNGVINDGDLVFRNYADLPADLKPAQGGPLPAPAVGAYETHMRNFANWFTFYRTRRASAQNALAIMISEIKNMMVGMMTSPPVLKQGLTWIDTNFNGIDYDNTANFLNVLYNLPAAGSARPFPADILDMGDYYEKCGGTFATAADKALLTVPGYSTAPGTYPFFKAEYGGTCQQAYALIITDGSSTGGSTIKNFDRGAPTDGVEDIDSPYDGGVFKNDANNTAADGAMSYYERDLIPSLANEVPTNYIDYARHQRMITYALSLGVEGPLRKAYPHFDALCADFNNNNACMCNDVGGCPTWSDPNPSPSNPTPMDPMDDLWHATVNSRGLFLYADNPMELIQRLREIRSDIERRQGAAAAVTTNTVQRTVDTVIYQGLYHSGGWWGDLLAKSVDVATGSIGTTLWSARQELEDIYWEDRKIFTSNGSSGMDFSPANAGAIGLTEAQVNYIRGDHSNEIPGGFRFREFKLGDIIHSEPYYYKGVIYVGANDGMMHAFDALTGAEMFAYVPSQVHAQLDEFTGTDYEHLYFVDATPHVNSIIGGPDYLVGGLGKGGKGVYCLNVTNAKTSPDASMFNWEFSDADDDDVGYVFGQAYVVKTHAGMVAIFSNGYVSANGKAVLFVLKVEDGSIIAKFDTNNTGTDGCNGLSSAALVDYNFDGTLDYVFAGDLDGNLWKFDLSDPDPLNWAIAYGGNPLFTARDPDGNVQAITSEPDIMRHCDRSRLGFIVAFGTGRYLNSDDLDSNPANQAIYGIYDWEMDWVMASKDPADKYLGVLQGHGGLSNIDFATLVEQTKIADVVVDGVIYRVTSDNPIKYYNPYLTDDVEQADAHAGWYYLLPNGTERVVRNPIIRGGVVIAVSNTIETGTCSGSAGSYLYTLNACSGGQPERAQFDLNNDGKFDELDKVTVTGADGNTYSYFPSGERFETMLFDPVAMSGPGGTVLYINDTFGNIEEEGKPPAGPNVRYWRLIE